VVAVRAVVAGSVVVSSSPAGVWLWAAGGAAAATATAAGAVARAAASGAAAASSAAAGPPARPGWAGVGWDGAGRVGGLIVAAGHGVSFGRWVSGNRLAAAGIRGAR